MPRKTKIFIDSNVWFSYFYGSSNCKKIVEAHANGDLKAVISQLVLEEVVVNLKKKSPASIAGFARFIESTPPLTLRNPGKILSEVKSCVDKKDQLIFQAAVNAKVKYFVTGNTKHFDVIVLKKAYKIEVLTPAQAVKKLGL